MDKAKNIRRAFVTVKVAAAVWYRPYVIGYFVGKKIHQHKTKKP